MESASPALDFNHWIDLGTGKRDILQLMCYIFIILISDFSAQGLQMKNSLFAYSGAFTAMFINVN